MSEANRDTPSRAARLGSAGAWLLLALISDLPDIVLHHLSLAAPTWLFSAKIGILVLALLLFLVLRTLRALSRFAAVMLVFMLGVALTGWVGRQPWWSALVPGAEQSFFMAYLKLYVLDTALALMVVLALRILTGSFAASYMGMGDLRAPMEPIPWLGIRKVESWGVFGWIFGLVAFLAVLIPTLLAMHPTAVNAFNEEAYFRASMMATLPAAVGKAHAELVCAVYFGLAHYLYGSPPGLIGAAMTGFLAWIMARAMLETRGIGWPWIIHMFPDAAIFFSYALAWGSK
jgi:membrane protease YdiL (CAAX protease family)